MPAKALLLFLLLSVTFSPVIAQTIKGEVLDIDTKEPVAGVNIENIYTSLVVNSNGDGSFYIAAAGGQLLEFKKDGYKTARARIPQGYIPPFFRILVKKGFSDIKSVDIAHTNRYNYAADSARSRELYKHELDFPKMSSLDVIQSPFSAMSGKNRAIWRFQEDYEETEKEKYVDKTFNEPLITKFTGLTGDSLKYFVRRYRPSYEQLRSMNDYTFFTYIKASAYRYRNVATPRNSR